MKNPNGVKPHILSECAKLDTYLQDMFALNAGMIMLNEHNSDTKKPEIRDGYNLRLKKNWLMNRSVFLTSKIRAQNDYLPEGMVVSILGSYAGRVLNT